MSVRTIAGLAAAAFLVIAAQAGAAPEAALSPAGKAAAAAVGGAPCSAGTRAFAARPRVAASLHTYDDFIEDSGAAPDFCASNFVTNDNEAIMIGLHIHNRSGFAAGDAYAISSTPTGTQRPAAEARSTRSRSTPRARTSTGGRARRARRWAPIRCP